MSDETQGAPEGVTETAADQVADQTDAQVQEGEAGDDAAAEAGEGEAQAKPKKTAQERIDELTRARREAEREAEHWRTLAMQTRQPEARPEPPKGDTEPDPSQYEYGESDLRYVKDLARYEARQEFRRQAEEEAAARQAREIEQGFAQRQEAAAAKYEDYHRVVIDGANRGTWACTPVMADAIKTSEAGPDVAYHLAKNPTEARRIAALSPIAQVRELTRLEVKLTAAPQPRTATSAPEPAPQARGAGGKFTVSPDTSDFAAFDKQYGN